MFEDFGVVDKWTGEQLHCVWKATVVAIATRHADATDIRFDVPNVAWVQMKRATGYVITDYAAAQAAGLYLKTIVENGYDNGREMYTMTVEEVLTNVKAVVDQAGSTLNLPLLPVIDNEVKPEEYAGHLPAE